MIAERAQYLRDTWRGKSCDHPSIETEYFKGKRTGAEVCTSCGKEFKDEKVSKLENRRVTEYLQKVRERTSR